MKQLLKLLSRVVGGALFALGAKLLTFGYDWQEVVKRHEEWKDTLPDDTVPRKRHAWN